MTVEVPGYRLAEPLGAGATGVVYAASRLADGGSVAIKVVHPEMVDPQYLDRLRREARLAAAVVHPGVVRVHEVGGERDQAWLVMDRLTGPDLQHLLASEGPLPAERAASLMIEVADAVDAMHAAGIIHRDLKPANVILHGGRPLVADFGVARQQAATGTDLTNDWLHSASGPPLGTMAGTVAYMSPEQWRGDPVTPATDVYALAGTLYTLLTNKPPYDRKTLPELAYAVAMLPAPTTGLPTYDAVIAKAMAKDPADRFLSAAAFAEALRSVVAGRTPVRRRPTRVVRWAAAAIAVSAVVAAGTAYAVHNHQAGDEQLTVCAQDATVRDAPRGKTVVATVYRGDRLTAVHPRDGEVWVHVRLPDGRTGWSLTDWVRRHC
ncbi:serine/threonine protein kinase [Kribbella sp. NPDC026611]|uniref:serine/threonine protein kinase n=1 Tax=Kribbella sp. NPDC026611 TaxID=3154911 RepID=UPI003401EEE0